MFYTLDFDILPWYFAFIFLNFFYRSIISAKLDSKVGLVEFVSLLYLSMCIWKTEIFSKWTPGVARFIIIIP